MAIEFGLLIISTYLLCSVPLAYLIAKRARGIDLRQHGSGNVGMSNLWKFTSPLLTAPLIIFDLGKGALMIGIAHILGPGQVEQVTIGVVAVIGHNWPIFLRLSGGRGILTTLGVILALPAINGMVPWAGIIALVIAAISIFPAHNLPLGVLIALVSLPLVTWGFGQPLPFVFGFLVICLLTIIRRLTAPRADISASLSTRELMINRLLLDRDIKDAKAWVNRRPTKK